MPRQLILQTCLPCESFAKKVLTPNNKVVHYTSHGQRTLEQMERNKLVEQIGKRINSSGLKKLSESADNGFVECWADARVDRWEMAGKAR